MSSDFAWYVYHNATMTIITRNSLYQCHVKSNFKKNLYTKRVSVSYVTVKPKRFLPKKYVNVKSSFLVGATFN